MLDARWRPRLRACRAHADGRHAGRAKCPRRGPKVPGISDAGARRSRPREAVPASAKVASLHAPRVAGDAARRWRPSASSATRDRNARPAWCDGVVMEMITRVVPGADGEAARGGGELVPPGRGARRAWVRRPVGAGPRRGGRAPLLDRRREEAYQAYYTAAVRAGEADQKPLAIEAWRLAGETRAGGRATRRARRRAGRARSRWPTSRRPGGEGRAAPARWRRGWWRCTGRAG